ncbi:hypothetical protein APR12_006864 [Nocardia amikacinitolerans]|nr:hypothetical protein [Nocardia amikacinitolerans]
MIVHSAHVCRTIMVHESPRNTEARTSSTRSRPAPGGNDDGLGTRHLSPDLLRRILCGPERVRALDGVEQRYRVVPRSGIEERWDGVVVQSSRWVRLLSEQPDRDPSFVLDANGFLNVERSRVHLELLAPAEAAEGRAFVLVGGPGIGKTTTLRLLVADRGGPPHSPGFPGTVWASAPELTDRDALTSIVGQYFSALPDLSSALSVDDPMLPAGLLTVVVDQLDEHPDLDRFVQQFHMMLEGKDTRGLNVLIACRAAEYPESLTSILKQVFGSCTVAELAPLTWDQAAAIAAQDVPDPEVLLEAISRSGSGSLASTPLTLRMLVSDRSLGNGHEWPARYIFDQKVRALLSSPHEPDTGLWESSLEERLAIASRIAAYLLLSGRRTLRIGRNAWAHNEEITPGLLASGREAAGLGEFDVTLAKVRDTLGTHMFAPGSESTEFAHSSVAAFLAARYLVDRSRSAPPGVSERQLSGVFLVSAPDEPTARIPEHLRETAAWMVGLAPRQSEWLASADPPSLAGYSMWIPDPEIRSVLAGGLLDRAERIELGGGAEWPRARWDLNHPGLAPQLSDILRCAVISTGYEWADLARVRVAVRLANDSRVAGVTPALLDLTQSRRWPVSVRQRAARAAVNCSPDSALPRLRDLLRQLVVTRPSASPLSDDDDFDGLSGDSELVGTLLSLLWPEYLSFDEAVAHIRPRRQTMAIGVYRGEADRFAREVGDGDLDRLLTYATAAIREFGTEPAASQLTDINAPDPVGIGQLLSITPEDEWGLREFIAPILERVFDSHRAEELLPATARMIAPLMRASIRIPMPARLELMDRDGTELSATTNLRRKLAHELVLHLLDAEQPFGRYAAYLIVAEWCHELAFAPGSDRLPLGTERGDRQRLLDDGDTAWCLAQIDMFLDAANAPLAQAYSLLITLIADPYNPHTFDLLENRPDSPEREHFRWVFDGMPIDDDYARAMRRSTAAQSSWDRADSFGSAQRERLVAAANRDSDAFWVLVRFLWVNPYTGRFEDARSLDVLNSPGVALWSPAEFSVRFRAAAMSYLESAHDHRDTWLGTANTDHRAEAGLIALAFLHRTEGTNGLRSLPPASWASWTAAILCGSPELNGQNPQLISTLLGFVTQHALSSLADSIDLWARTALRNGIPPWSLGQVVPLLPREVHPRMVTLAIELFDTLCSPATAHSASFHCHRQLRRPGQSAACGWERCRRIPSRHRTTDLVCAARTTIEAARSTRHRTRPRSLHRGTTSHRRTDDGDSGRGGRPVAHHRYRAAMAAHSRRNHAVDRVRAPPCLRVRWPRCCR